MMVSVRKAAGLAAAVVAAAVVVVGCGDDNPGGSGHTHSWGNWSVTTPATCDAPGLEIKYCTLDNSHFETQTIAQLTGSQCAAGCIQWSEWAQTSPATCTGPGLQTRTCIAGASDTETQNQPAQLTGSSCASVSTFTDSRDGQTYSAVTIGTQTWMAENLNYDAGDGSVCYDSLASNCDTYGRLYDWATVMDGASSSESSPSGVQGVCPVGWHVPSDAEWETLVKYVDPNASGNSSNNAGTKLKSKSGWNNNGNGTDEYGFSALPGGGGSSVDFGNAGDFGNWWSATEVGASSARSRYMDYNYDFVDRFSNHKTNLYSVRCVRDSAAPQ